MTKGVVMKVPDEAAGGEECTVYPRRGGEERVGEKRMKVATPMVMSPVMSGWPPSVQEFPPQWRGDPMLPDGHRRGAEPARSQKQRDDVPMVGGEGKKSRAGPKIQSRRAGVTEYPLHLFVFCEDGGVPA